MKKKLFSAIVAALLVFGLAFISCDTGSDSTGGAKIPEALYGTYQAAGYIVKINPNGSGTIDGAGCSFSEADGELTVKMGSETVTMGYTESAAGIAFNFTGDKAGYLSYVFTAIAAAGPVKSVIGGDVQNVIPDELIGEWENTGITIWVINGDGTGKVYNTATFNMDDSKWSVPSAGKLKLEVYIGTAYESDATFDYTISNGTLTLTAGVGGEGAVAAAIALYTGFSPMTAGTVEIPPDISDFVFQSAIPADFAGDWASKAAGFEGLTIYKINSNGTGQMFISSDPFIVDCTYGITADKKKMKVTAFGFGGAMYDCTITAGELTIANSILTDGASSGLSLYVFFNPMEKSE